MNPFYNPNPPREPAAKVAVDNAPVTPAQREQIRLKSESSAQPKGSAPISLDARREVFERDAGRCRGCGTTVDIQYDQLTPSYWGGSSEPENLQLLCGTCNWRKGASRIGKLRPRR